MQPDLVVSTLPVSSLVPYAENARTHSPSQVAQIAASIAEFGFVNPVLVDAEGVLIAGHGRVMAAKQLGLATVPVLLGGAALTRDYVSQTCVPAYPAPVLYAEDAFETGDEPLVGDFRRGALGKARVGADDRCPCGSGLPFRRCCGRQASCVEIEYGRPAGSH